MLTDSAARQLCREVRDQGPLLGLVLDASDTFVTRATADALLRRQDSAEMRRTRV